MKNLRLATKKGPCKGYVCTKSGQFCTNHLLAKQSIASANTQISTSSIFSYKRLDTYLYRDIW